MENSLHTLQLFQGMQQPEVAALLRCFDACVKDPPERADSVMIVLHGGMLLAQEDVRGNRTILGFYGPGEFIGGYGAFDIIARPGTQCLLLGQKSLCEKACLEHSRFAQNLAECMHSAQARLLRKLDILSRRTTREKILCSLSQWSDGVLPFNRQEFADYLCVDRSAMCTELSRMQRDGLLRLSGRNFELL